MFVFGQEELFNVVKMEDTDEEETCGGGDLLCKEEEVPSEISAGKQ